MLRTTALEQKVYEREISSYCHYLPLLRQIRSDAGLSSTDIPLDVPEIYYSKLDQPEKEGDANVTVLVMEELNTQGFRMADVRVGCTAEEAQLTLSTLANYHALSIMLLRKHRNPDGSYSLPDTLHYALRPVTFCQMTHVMVSKNLPIIVALLRHLEHEEVNIFHPIPNVSKILNISKNSSKMTQESRKSFKESKESIENLTRCLGFWLKLLEKPSNCLKIPKIPKNPSKISQNVSKFPIQMLEESRKSSENPKESIENVPKCIEISFKYFKILPNASRIH